MPEVGAFLLGAANAFGAGTWVASAASVGAFSAGFTVGNVLATSFVGRLLTSVALSALSMAMAPRPRAPGIRTSQTQTGGTNPCQFILGRYATGGYAASPAMSHGKAGKTPNAYLTYVIEVSDAPVTAINGLILDGTQVSIGASVHPDYGNEIGGDFQDRAWIRFYAGSQTAADPMLLAKYADYRAVRRLAVSQVRRRRHPALRSAPGYIGRRQRRAAVGRSGDLDLQPQPHRDDLHHPARPHPAGWQPLGRGLHRRRPAARQLDCGDECLRCRGDAGRRRHGGMCGRTPSSPSRSGR